MSFPTAKSLKSCAGVILRLQFQIQVYQFASPTLVSNDLEKDDEHGFNQVLISWVFRCTALQCLWLSFQVVSLLQQFHFQYHLGQLLIFKRIGKDQISVLKSSSFSTSKFDNAVCATGSQLMSRSAR